MKVEFRKLHRQLAPILFFPLLASALTGVAYRLGKSWFGIPDLLADILMIIHQGEYLGEKLAPVYVILIALGILGMSITGLTLLISSNNVDGQTKPDTRSIHRLLGLILILPLSISAETGVAYRLGRDWFGMSSEQAEFLLTIHQGLYLGSTFSVFYVFLLGLGLVGLLIAGIRMRLGTRNNVRSQAGQSSAKMLSQSTLSNAIISLRRKAWSGIAIFSIVFFGIVYGVTSRILSKKYSALPTDIETEPTHQIYIQDLLISIGIVVLVFGIVASVIAEKLIQNWRREKEIQAELFENETATNTILKAVPDSMLIVNLDGTCLSYMPAKGAKTFILNGDILGKNVTELLPLEIAHKLIEYARLALQSGLTLVYQFSLHFDDGTQYQEARISAIGEAKFLIMMREIASEPAIEPSPQIHDDTSNSLVNQQELIQQLELTIEDTKNHAQHHVLCYIAVELQVTIGDELDSPSGDNLLKQVGENLRNHLLPTNLIARLDSNELAILLRYYSLEKASKLADELRQDLNNFSFSWQNQEYPISVSIGLVEIDANSSDVTSLMNAAEAACQMAKRKITSKAFW